MFSFRRHFLPLFLVLLISLPVAEADIVFNTDEISPLTWPWPAAVSPEDELFDLAGRKVEMERLVMVR